MLSNEVTKQVGKKKYKDTLVGVTTTSLYGKDKGKYTITI